MRAALLRLIVILWLMMSPLNVTVDSPREIAEPAARPIELRSPIELQPPFRPLSAGAPQTITLQIVPDTLIANSGATAFITATVYDITGAVVEGANLTRSITSGRGTVGVFPTTDLSGTTTSTWTATIGSSTVGTGTIQVITDTVLGSAFITLTADVPQTVTLTAGPTNLTVGATSVLTATVVDQYGNLVDDGTSVTFASSLGVIPSPRPTSGGIATSTITSTVAGTAYITATSAGRSGFFSVVFNPGVPFSMTLQANPASLTVDNSATLTATVADQYNNFVTNNTPVTITSSLGTVLSPRFTGNGIATSTITSTLVGTAFITATSGTVSGTASVVFNPGVPFSMTLQASPASLTVGSIGSLTATVADQYNNPVTNSTNVTFTSSLGTVLSPRPTNNGIATSTITSTVAGTAYITATSGAVSRTASVVFNPGAPFSMTLQASPASLTVGSTGSLTATVADQYNNPVTNNTSVTFTSSLGTVLSPRLTTNGIATSTFTSTVAGTAVITAASGTVSRTTSVVFNPGAPYTLTIQPPTAVISAGQRITYTAVATDVFGNAIGSVTGSTTFSIALASGGVFAANVVTPTIKNTWIVTGFNGSAVSTATLTVTAAAFNRLSIEDAPAGSGSTVNAVALDIYATLTVFATAYDAYNNLIGARSVNWGGTGVVTGNFTPTTGTSTTFTPVLSGTGTITATSGGITDTTGTITVRAPLLRISKSASPDPLTPGQNLQYTIIYTNVGNATAQGVVITETYPPSTTFSFAFPPPTSGNNVWTIGMLPPGEAHTIAVFLTTPSQMPVGTVLTNTVHVGASKVATAITTTTTIVNALPNLSASIIDLPDPARPGDLLVYAIQYRNDGTAPVTNVRITETYPAQVTFVSAVPTPTLSNNVWLTSTLNGNGDSRTILVTVRVNAPLTDTTVLNNQVVVAAQQAPPYTTTQQTLVVAPRLSLTKSANPSTPTANGLLTYTLGYANSGSSYAANTFITDALPANTSFMQCQPIGCALNSGIVTWNLGQLDQQTSDAVTLTVRVANNLANGTIITNTARISSTDLVWVFTALTQTVTSAPDVTLSKTDVITQIAAGQFTTYTLSYNNAGTAPAAGVVITDRIPDYTTFVSCSSCVAVGGGVYSFTLGTLSASQSGAVNISVRMSPTLPAGLRVITNTAAIRTTTPGDNTGNNTAQDVNLVSTVPTLALSPFYDSSTPYPGKVITYTLRYTNTSGMDTVGVVITVAKPVWVASSPPGWTLSGTTDMRVVGDLAAGQSGLVTYVVTLPLTYTADMNAFTLTFAIQDDGPGGLAKAYSQTTPFIGVPDLSIAQVIVPSTVAPGQKFTATLIIRNNGPGRACNPSTSNCSSGFWVDAFINPATPPPSYPFQSYGNPFVGAPPINPGLTATVFITNLVFTLAQQPILYFKVDNFGCPGQTCLPVGSQGGLVPEYDEYNNVAGPFFVPRFAVYLPLIRKSQP